MNRIAHPRAAVDRLKFMRVLPEPVRSTPLHIDEAMGRVPVGDFGYPAHWHAMPSEAIPEQHPAAKLIRDRRQNGKVQPEWSGEPLLTLQEKRRHGGILCKVGSAGCPASDPPPDPSRRCHFRTTRRPPRHPSLSGGSPSGLGRLSKWNSPQSRSSNSMFASTSSSSKSSSQAGIDIMHQRPRSGLASFGFFAILHS